MRWGYRDVSLNKIIIKTKAPPIRPFPRAALVSIQIDPRSALRGFIAGVLQFGDASELHFREFVDTSLPEPRLVYAYHYQNMNKDLVFRHGSGSQGVRLTLWF